MFCVCVYIFINEEFDLDLFLKLIKVSLKDKVGLDVPLRIGSGVVGENWVNC